MTLLTVGAGRRNRNIFTAGAPPINVHVEGNSISADHYTSYGTFDNHLMAIEPLASASGAVHSCTAVTSSRWTHIIERLPTVQGKWRDGYTNILVLNEHINTLFNGQTVESIQGWVTSYLSDLLAGHPWRVIYWRTLPYGGGYATMNANMTFLDDWMEENADELGIEIVINPRVIDAFNHDGTSSAPFYAYIDLWNENAVPFVHPLDPPKLELAALIVAAMADMQVRP